MYQTEFDGIHHELGTSGFLYRSNKLMYDADTNSLWSTLKGEPVVGPLVGRGIKLQRRHVVTTTWRAWRQQYPDTTVLSLDTGHKRDYGEGVAYRDYFATDRLMFDVPKTDTRLRNKDEVVALRKGEDQLAVSADFLLEHRVFQNQIGGRKFVILTDDSGANRVYECGDVVFDSWDEVDTVADSEFRGWKVTAESISRGDQSFRRLPSHRAFWFGWYAQYPDSRLIK